MRCPHCNRKIGGASWNEDPSRPAASKPGVPEGGATSRVLTCEDVGRPQCCPDPAPPAPHPEALSLVNAQAEDPALWAPAETAPEAYIQRALRALHAAVEAAPHPEVVDRPLADELAEALRGHMQAVSHEDCAGTACRRAQKALVRYDALSSSPPSLLRTAEQEREGRLLRELETLVRAVDGSRRGCTRWPAIRDVLHELTRVRRGDHLQTPGSEGEG